MDSEKPKHKIGGYVRDFLFPLGGGPEVAVKLFKEHGYYDIWRGDRLADRQLGSQGKVDAACYLLANGYLEWEDLGINADYMRVPFKRLFNKYFEAYDMDYYFPIEKKPIVVKASEKAKVAKLLEKRANLLTKVAEIEAALKAAKVKIPKPNPPPATSA